MYQFPDLQVTESMVLIPEGFRSLKFLIYATERMIHRIIGELNEQTNASKTTSTIDIYK